jgi:hypothetical protein
VPEHIADAVRWVKSEKNQFVPLRYWLSVKLIDTLPLAVKKSDMTGGRAR